MCGQSHPAGWKPFQVNRILFEFQLNRLKVLDAAAYCHAQQLGLDTSVWCCCDGCLNRKTLLIDEHHVMVSCHPVPRPVIHRDLQPESVSSSDCAKVMHCPFLKEFLSWKAVEPCKTRTGIVDLLDTLIFIF